MLGLANGLRLVDVDPLKLAGSPLEIGEQDDRADLPGVGGMRGRSRVGQGMRRECTREIRIEIRITTGTCAACMREAAQSFDLSAALRTGLHQRVEQAFFSSVLMSEMRPLNFEPIE